MVRPPGLTALDLNKYCPHRVSLKVARDAMRLSRLGLEPSAESLPGLVM